MKTLAAILVLSLAFLAGATEAKFTVSEAGQPIGTATLSSAKLPDGGSKFTVDTNIDFSGTTIHQHQEDSYDKNSKPTLSTSLVEQGSNKTEIRLEYGYATVAVTTTVNGKKTQKVVRFPMGKSVVKPSQLWFFSVRPQRNKISKEIEYDARKGSWVDHQRVYVGPGSISFGGKQVTAFELDDKNASDDTVVKQFVDEHGMPYRIEIASATGTMTLERIAN